MSLNVGIYNPRQTPMHRLDARCKIVLMLVYSVVLFLVETWVGLGALAALLAVAAAAARLNLARAIWRLPPVVFIAAVTLIANSFALDVSASTGVLGNASAGVFEGASPIALIGSFGFLPAGFMRGCFYAVRIVLLVGASLVLTTTTSSTNITRALESFLRPLGRLGVPVRDVATVVSIALRFIPLTIEEFQRVRSAQASRGAQFDTGRLIERLQAWRTVLVPWFVGLYRRADDLANALDARCYGAAVATRVDAQTFDANSVAVLAAGLLACIGIAIAF